MKIIVIGASGAVGKKVCEHFSKKHKVISAGRQSGDINVDMSNSDSIVKMYQQIGRFDALICIAGEAKWGLFDTLTEEDYSIGLMGKLMGQVNLVRLGQGYINVGGSYTLTTGILGDHPVMQTTSAAMVNGAIHSFVKAASLELTNARINAISFGLVEDSVGKYGDFFPGHNPIPMYKVINSYIKSVEGRHHGKIIRTYDNC